MSATIDVRLDAYQRQAQFYCKTQYPQDSKRKLTQSTLAALVPLAAGALLPAIGSAQCPMETVAVTSSQPGSGCPKIYMDMDGGGNDIYFEVGSSFIHVVGLNTVSFMGNELGHTYFPINYAANTTTAITAGEVAISNGIMLSFNPSYYNNGNSEFSPGTVNGYLTLKMDGRLGFVELSIDPTTRCVTLGEYGMDHSPIPRTSIKPGDCGTLPVELLSFQARVEEQTIVLHWVTASEEANSGFELQRSTNGKDFRKLAWLAGSGSSLEVQQYAYQDEEIQVNQTYYYRLKQVDMDGKAEYFQIVSAEVKDGKRTLVSEVLPNPVTDVARFELYSPKEQDATVYLFDSAGRSLQNIERSLDKGAQVINLNVNDLVAGTYYVKFDFEDSSSYQKLIKL